VRRSSFGGLLRTQRASIIDHDFLFFQENGAPILNLPYPYDRWRYVLEKTRFVIASRTTRGTRTSADA